MYRRGLETITNPVRAAPALHSPACQCDPRPEAFAFAVDRLPGSISPEMQPAYACLPAMSGWLFVLLIACYSFRSTVYTYELPVGAPRPSLLSSFWRDQAWLRLHGAPQRPPGFRVPSCFRVPPSCALNAVPVLSDGAVEPISIRTAASEAAEEDLTRKPCQPTGTLPMAGSVAGERMIRRDHKTLGSTMDLFCFPKPRLGSMGGLGPALLPRGQVLMLQLQEAVRKLQREQGFEEVTGDTEKDNAITAPCQDTCWSMGGGIGMRWHNIRSWH